MKVLMYHYIQKFDSKFPSFLFLNVDNFEKQIAHLSADHRIISPTDDLIFELSNASESNSVALLTFDDGLKCHYRFVLPIVGKHNVQGIFYIPTAPYTDGRVLGVHKIHLMLGKENHDKIAERLKNLLNPEMLDAEHVHQFSQYTYPSQGKYRSAVWIKRCLNYFIDFRFRDELIDRLFVELFGPVNETEIINQIYLSLEEIREMARAGMVIGSHGRTHRLLSKLSRGDVLEEIDSSYDFLETIVPLQPFRTFCYPYGGFHSFNSTIEKVLTDRNVAFSFNVESRDLTSEDYHGRPQALPRYDCNEFDFGTVDTI